MKRVSLILVLSIIFLNLHAQKSELVLDTINIPFVYSLDEEIKDRLLEDTVTGLVIYLERIATTSDFIHTTTMLRSPSKISFPFGSIQFNSVKELQKKPFIIHANLQPPIVIANKNWFRYKRMKKFGGGERPEHAKLLMAIHVLPIVDIRIFSNDTSTTKAFKDISLPVRTPSFKPKVSFLISNHKLWNKVKYINEDIIYKKKYFDFEAFHYSNGQDGIEFDTTTNYFNSYNGNFSDDLVIGFYTNHLRIVDKGRYSYSLFNRIGYEYNGFKINNKKIRNEKIYHRNKIKYRLGFIYSKSYKDVFNYKNSTAGKKWVFGLEDDYSYEVFRVFFNFDLIPDANYQRVRKDYFYVEDSNNDGDILDQSEDKGILVGRLVPVKWDLTKRLNASLEAHLRIKGTNATGFIETGWWGSDPYNAYFQESKFYFRFGLGFGFLEDQRKSRSKEYKKKAELLKNITNE